MSPGPDYRRLTTVEIRKRKPVRDSLQESSWGKFRNKAVEQERIFQTHIVPHQETLKLLMLTI